MAFLSTSKAYFDKLVDKNIAEAGWDKKLYRNQGTYKRYDL